MASPPPSVKSGWKISARTVTFAVVFAPDDPKWVLLIFSSHSPPGAGGIPRGCAAARAGRRRIERAAIGRIREGAKGVPVLGRERLFLRPRPAAQHAGSPRWLTA